MLNSDHVRNTLHTAWGGTRAFWCDAEGAHTSATCPLRITSETYNDTLVNQLGNLCPCAKVEYGRSAVDAERAIDLLRILRKAEEALASFNLQGSNVREVESFLRTGRDSFKNINIIDEDVESSLTDLFEKLHHEGMERLRSGRVQSVLLGKVLYQVAKKDIRLADGAFVDETRLNSLEWLCAASWQEMRQGNKMLVRAPAVVLTYLEENRNVAFFLETNDKNEVYEAALTLWNAESGTDLFEVDSVRNVARAF